MDELKSAMLEAFATLYAYNMRCKNYHWNVEGSDFLEYHELFHKLASKSWKSLDKFAEKIRTMEVYVPASFHELSELSDLAVENTEDIPILDRVKKLYRDSEVVIDSIKKANNIAKIMEHDEVTEFLAHLLDKQYKQCWILLASMKQ